jgi:hypothetical protein
MLTSTRLVRAQPHVLVLHRRVHQLAHKHPRDRNWPLGLLGNNPGRHPRPLLALLPWPCPHRYRLVWLPCQPSLGVAAHGRASHGEYSSMLRRMETSDGHRQWDRTGAIKHDEHGWVDGLFWRHRIQPWVVTFKLHMGNMIQPASPLGLSGHACATTHVRLVGWFHTNTSLMSTPSVSVSALRGSYTTRWWSSLSRANPRSLCGTVDDRFGHAEPDCQL